MLSWLSLSSTCLSNDPLTDGAAHSDNGNGRHPRADTNCPDPWYGCLRDTADCNTDDWRYGDGDGADVIVIPVLYYLCRRHDLARD